MIFVQLNTQHKYTHSNIQTHKHMVKSIWTSLLVYNILGKVIGLNELQCPAPSPDLSPTQQVLQDLEHQLQKCPVWSTPPFHLVGWINTNPHRHNAKCCKKLLRFTAEQMNQWEPIGWNFVKQKVDGSNPSSAQQIWSQTWTSQSVHSLINTVSHWHAPTSRLMRSFSESHAELRRPNTFDSVASFMGT